MLTLVMKLAPVPTLTAACSPFEVAKAALIASRGKRKMRCEIVPSCDLFSKKFRRMPRDARRTFPPAYDRAGAIGFIAASAPLGRARIGDTIGFACTMRCSHSPSSCIVRTR